MKQKRKLRVVISFVLAIALVLSNLSPISWMTNKASTAQAADTVDLSNLDEINWADFGVETKLQLRFDATASRTDGADEDLRVYFFNQAQESGVCDKPYVETIIPTNETTKVEMDLEKFLVDGAFPGFAFAIQNGPAWDSGVTLTMQISNVQIVGNFTKDIDMSNGTWSSGGDTGLTGGNNWGNISCADGVTTLSGMINFSTHEVTFAEPVTTEVEPKLCFDVNVTRTDGAEGDLRVYFFNKMQESGVCDAPYVEVVIPMNKTTKVEMNLEDFLVDGALPGFAFSIQNGPAWDSGVTLTMQISNVQMVGNFTKDIDMSNGTWSSGGDTGLTGGNNWGSISCADGVTTLSGMINFSTHEVTFAKPATTEAEPKLCFDVNTTRTDGAEGDLRVYFFNKMQESGVCDAPYVEVVIPMNKTTKVEMNLEDFLVDGALPGFAFSIQNGPAWDSGVTLTMQISNVQIVGDLTKDIDMSNGTWSSGGDTGLTGGNNWGSISCADGVTTLSGMINFSTHEVTFSEPVTTKPVEEEPELKLRFDVTASTANGSMEEIKLAFFNHSYVGRVDGSPHIEKILPANGEKTEVVMNLDDFLVDGAFPGFMFSVLGGPAWDSGDTATVAIENMQFIGDFKKNIDLSTATWAKGTDGTGMEASNGWGNASYSDGVTTISGMIFTDAHKVTFAEPVTREPELQLRFDVTASTANGSMEEITLAFFNHSYVGRVDGEPHIKKKLQANGEKTEVLMSLEDFLVDGALPGFMFSVLGGPAWDSGDTAAVKIENLQIVSDFTKDIDMSTASWAKGVDGTGMEASNGWGNVSYADGATTISGMIFTDAHKVTFAEPVTTEPVEEEPELQLRFDVTASTANGSMEEIKLAFFNHSYVGRVDGEPHIEKILPANGEKTEVVMNLDNFLVDGALPGFMFSVLGGPAWDSGDTAAVKIENLQIISDFTKDIDMSTASWAKGVDGTGMESSNGWGNVSYGDGVTTISGMIFTDAHKVTFAEPVTTEPEWRLCFDVAASTQDGTTEEIKVRFFNHSYTGNIDGEPYVQKMLPADGTTTEVGIPLYAFLQDGKFHGFGFGILNGPEWNSPTNDRTTLKFKNVRLEKDITHSIDLTTVTWTGGTETGITGSNNWGSASCSGGVTTISGMICYEAHEMTLAEPLRITETLFELQNTDTLDNTIFNGDILFKEGGVLYYGAEESGLAISLKNNGKLKISAKDYAFSNETYASAYDASYFGLETFTETQFNLKIAMAELSSDGKSAKVAIWINNILIGDGYVELEANSADAIPISNTILYNTDTVITYATTYEELPIIVEVPTGLSDLTWEDFGFTCIGQVATTTYGQLSGKEMNNSLFSGDITMQADSHIRYAGSSGDFGLHIQVNSDETLSLRSDTCSLGLQTTTFYPKMYGLESFANTRFNLKIAVTDLTETTARVGVWVNNKILGDYFTLACTGAYNATLGNAMALYSGTVELHSTLPKPTGLTSIRLGDWDADVYEDGLLYWDEISGDTAAHPTLDTLVGTSFVETITFPGPTDSTDSNYVIYYGGAKDQAEAAYGLRIAFVDDYIKLYGAGSYGLNSFNLTADVAGVDSFVDTEYILQLDSVKRGNHVLFYMYFDGKLYGGAPFVLPGFADVMNDTFSFYPFPAVGTNNAQVQKPAVIAIAERALSDLYHDLDESKYIIPSGVISMQKKVITDGEVTWSDMEVTGGDNLDTKGDYKILYGDGVSKYAQEVVLYRSGDTKLDDMDNIGSTDLVRIIRYIKGQDVTAYKCEEKAYDANGDYIVDDETDTMRNKEVKTIRQMILETYEEDTSKVMPILGHYGPIDDTIADDIYRLIREVGINQITQYQNPYTDNPTQRYEVYEQLALSQKYGLKITVNDDRLTGDPSNVTLEDVESAIVNYKDYQSFAGLYMSDEPKTDSYPPNYKWTGNDEKLEEFVPFTQAVNEAGIYGYANAIGYSYNYAQYRTAQYMYTNYLRTFVDEYKVSFLSHTQYPFWESHPDVGGSVTNSKDYFQNLAMVRHVANEKGIPFWTFVQSGDGFELTPMDDNPSEGEFKWNANMGLAFGAKGLQYFPLVQPENFINLEGEISSGLLSSTGEKTRWYGYAVDVNAQVQAIDHVLMNATNVGIMATGGYAKTMAADNVKSIALYTNRWYGSATETISTPIHTSYNGATVTCTDGTYGALTGCFEYGDKHALYIVNYNVTGDNTVTVTFSSETNATLIHNAEKTKQTGTSMNITLGAGEAVLVVY